MPIGWAVFIIALWVVTLVLAVVILGVLRQVSPVLEQAAARLSALAVPDKGGPPVGEQVPHFSAHDTSGELVADDVLHGRAVLLLFLSAGCGPCERLAAALRRADLGALAEQMIVVTTPDAPAILNLPAGLRLVTESRNEITSPLEINALPFTVSIDSDGIVRAAETPGTVEDLSKLTAVLS